MRRQSGFSLVDVMTALAVLSILSIVIVKGVAGQRNHQRLQETSQQMTSIARIVSDYRRLRNSAGDYVANGTPVDVATLNTRFDISLPLENPWGGDYEVVTGPVSEIVRTDVPVKVSPSGFRVTVLSGNRTRLETQHVGRSGSRYTKRIRLIKAQIYQEDSR